MRPLMFIVRYRIPVHTRLFQSDGKNVVEKNRFFVVVNKSILNKVTIGDYIVNCCMTTGVDAWCTHTMSQHLITTNSNRIEMFQSLEVDGEQSQMVTEHNMTNASLSVNAQILDGKKCEL